MCGIVGYTGNKPAEKILLDGLKRLEYRGYDSAGLSLGGRELLTIKAVGKVRNLEQEARKYGELKQTIGIAHTRWATHGAPSVRNAHPHVDNSGKFAIVHNGIIENYAELKQKLVEKGYTFSSDTDTEVVANLIAEFYKGDFVQAVASALHRISGTYGFAILCTDYPDTILVARHGSPIVIGLGDGCNLVASDVTPLAAYTRKVIYLDDGDLAVLTPDNVELRTIENLPVEREVANIDWDVASAGKGKYEHFMLKEIFEQPDSISNTIRGRLDRKLKSAMLSGLGLTPHELAKISRIVIAGCGTSLHAGMVGEYFFEDIAGIPAEVEQAAEFRYRNPIIDPDTLVLPISQSGETADTLAAVREAMNKGAVVAAICNVVGSTIARETGRGIYLHAGPEISVASTKAFTCQVTVLLMLALMLGRNRRLSRDDGDELLQEIERIPDLIRETLKQAPAIEKLAEKYAFAEDFFFIGRGTLYPTALEGALKLKEISYIHAEGYHAAELKHGPIALLDSKVPVMALANAIPGQEKMIGNIQECLARNSPVVAVVTGDDDRVCEFTQDIIRLPASSRYVAPLTTVVALQLFAYYFAKARGCEIDHPRNLAKSVTVE